MRDLKDIYATDARSITEFNRIGYHYTKIEETEDYMIWEMTKGTSKGYELWKPKWKTNPDGTKVWAKPSDDDFGIYAWYNANLNLLKQRIPIQPSSF